jgi:methyl-accepting chemotaxis protein
MMEIQTELDQLNESADETASLSQEVSNASNENAQGATEQQSILEGTISGFKEMSHILATNAQQAQSNYHEVESMKKRMQELDESIQSVNESGKQIASILSTIDSIAFQTNLLALNASVEAARAGEAGAGFSVVADEVRTLAKKTGEASKQIEELIGSNVQNINQAGSKAEEVNNAFTRFQEVSSQIAETFKQVQDRTDEFKGQHMQHAIKQCLNHSHN